MKTRLQRIEIRNFKAFRKFELNLGGNHLLVYGPNGSGKSSLYWALHCFLQSARKSTADVAKYFDPGNSQSLLNILENPTENPGEIALTLREMATKTDTTYRLSLTTHGTHNVPIIRTGDLASDFITYRFFFGFSHFRNSEEFNIWPLFEKEILPFCVSTSGQIPLEAWNSIKSGNPNPLRYPGIAGTAAYNSFRSRVSNFATILSAVVDTISDEAQKFYDKHFAADDAKPVTLKLGVTKPPSFTGTNQSNRKFTRPSIALGIQIGGQTIQRPQAFLNEAKLTQLALSVRFAASLVNLHQSDLKLLVLDDLLVSLDMSNRMKVVEILMSDTFKDYQKIILTHDLGLFQEVRRHIGEAQSEWLFCKIDSNAELGPQVTDRKSELEWAIHHLNNGLLDECGNRLRKCAEANLEAFLVAAREKRGLAPIYDRESFSSLGNKLAEAKGILESGETSKFAALLQSEFSEEELAAILGEDSIDPTTITAVDNHVKGQIVAKLKAARSGLHDAICESLTAGSRKRRTAVNLLKDVENIKDRILNPASHAGVTPIYTKEAEDAVKVIQALESALTAALATL